ncbi:MAG: oligosaccharide flippase family protein [Clostridia bacterium]
MKNKLVKSSIIVVVAGFISKIIGAVYRIPLSNLLGPQGMGGYQMVYPIFAFALVFVCGGVQVSLARVVAQKRATNTGGQKKDLFNAIAFCFVTSILFSLCFIFLNNQICAIQGNPNGRLGIACLSIALVFASITAPIKGYFEGKENMIPSAISSITEQIAKLCFGLLFAFLFAKKGIEYAIFGACLGVSVAEIISFVAILFCALSIKRKSLQIKTAHLNNNLTQFRLFKDAIPLSFSAIVFPFVSLISSFLVVNLLSSYTNTQIAVSLYGVQSGMVAPLINFPATISLSLGVAFLPNYSYLLSLQKNHKKSLSSMLFFVWLFALPCTVGFFVLSKQILALLYPFLTGESLEIAISLLKISSIGIVFIAIFQICISALQAMARGVTCLVISFITAIFNISLMIILVQIPQVGILGVAISNTFGFAIGAVLALWQTKKHGEFNMPINKSILPLVFSLAMGIFIYLLSRITQGFPLILQSCLLVIFGVALYFAFIFGFKVLAFGGAKVDKCSAKDIK